MNTFKQTASLDWTLHNNKFCFSETFYHLISEVKLSCWHVSISVPSCVSVSTSSEQPSSPWSISDAPCRWQDLPRSPVAPPLDSCFLRPARPANRRPPSRWARSPTSSPKWSDVSQRRFTFPPSGQRRPILEGEEPVWAGISAAPRPPRLDCLSFVFGAQPVPQSLSKDSQNQERDGLGPS